MILKIIGKWRDKMCNNIMLEGFKRALNDSIEFLNKHSDIIKDQFALKVQIDKDKYEEFCKVCDYETFYQKNKMKKVIIKGIKYNGKDISYDDFNEIIMTAEYNKKWKFHIRLMYRAIPRKETPILDFYYDPLTICDYKHLFDYPYIIWINFFHLVKHITKSIINKYGEEIYEKENEYNFNPYDYYCVIGYKKRGEIKKIVEDGGYTIKTLNAVTGYLEVVKDNGDHYDCIHGDYYTVLNEIKRRKNEYNFNPNLRRRQ